MDDTKISDLPATDAAANADEVAVATSGATRKISIENLRDSLVVATSVHVLATWQGDLPLAVGVGATWRVPDYAETPLVFDLNRAFGRVETAGSDPTSVVIEKSAAGGAFVPVAITALTIAAAAHEDVNTGLLGFVGSGDLLRINWIVLGTTGIYTVELEGVQQPLE